jgi:hypothetical protein
LVKRPKYAFKSPVVHNLGPDESICIVFADVATYALHFGYWPHAARMRLLI